MDYNTIKINIQQAEQILFECFNIKGDASPLPGYIDFNFKITIENEEPCILKISRPGEDEKYLDFQQKLLQFIGANKQNLITPEIIKDKNGNTISEIKDKYGIIRKVRLLTWVPGRLWINVNPQLDNLRFSLGKICGKITKAFQGFEHEEAHRKSQWDIVHSLWTKEYLHLFNKEEKAIITHFQQRFEAVRESCSKLRKSIIHNDANDSNVVVSPELINPEVKAVIDYGDALYTQIINDLAITCAYNIMYHNDPLEAALPIVKGYHATFPLQEEELAHLYTLIPMRLIASVTQSAINKIKEPENEYLFINEKPGWKLLKKWHTINADFAHYCFRHACGFPAHPNEEKFKQWAAQNNFGLAGLFPTINSNKVHHLDLGVASKWIGHQEEFNDLDLFQFKIEKLQAQQPGKIIAGGYLEPRPLYTSSAYDKIGNNGRESRTVHLGIDFWLPAQTPVHALFDGEVITVVNDAGDKEYGGLIILKHHTGEVEFYTLYGHLSVESALRKTPGQVIKKGDCIGHLGTYPENGNWAPHLHFQIMFSMLDYKIDFPGVAYPRQVEAWKSLCPDPNLLFKSDTLKPKPKITDNKLIAYRKKHLGKSLSLHYKTPVKMVRGAGQYLIDEFGKKYLDIVNNVAHVGHEHPAVVKAGREQMALLNTNSRYLHENINTLAKALMETLPPELNVVHFVNSGSEANELAIRMVKAATGERDIIASEAGYHGNSNMCVDISSYKFNGKGGSDVPEYTHVFPLPDAFRGKYRGADAAEKYAGEVKKCIEKIREKGRGIGALIVEPIISCGGQIELPEGFLAQAYNYAREAGGICISDEVQTGCGRVGKTFWGFQLHNVIPDIVTIGKPLGNGHPLAAVVCTQEIADKFANGMEYFNTFGGNPVSCAIGAEVLRTVKNEKLQENALKVGAFLKSELKELAKTCPIIGDVRGQGLFLGVELVDAELNPLAAQTNYLVNRMKNHGILMSFDGQDNNVLKIKPPMVFSIENAKELIFYIRKVLHEDFMRI